MQAAYVINGGIHKQAWQWQVTKQAEARHLMVLVRPLMGERRAEKIDEVLAATSSVDRRFKTK